MRFGLAALCVLASLVTGSGLVQGYSTSDLKTTPSQLQPKNNHSSGSAVSVEAGTSINVATTATDGAINITTSAARPVPPPSPYPSLNLGAKSNSVLRLQELLSGLGYLPVTFKPANIVRDTTSNQNPYISHPPMGAWTWTYKATPVTLKQFWRSGVYTVLTQGAVMHYQAVTHLPVDGIAGPQVWSHLIADYLKKHKNPDGYSYVYTSTSYPETLRLWKNGSIVLTSLVNTGVSGARTPSGTWPIYVRFTSQTMSGHTPSGQYYSDPGVPWVNYFYGGCAIHGFYRSGYGYPQSLGCIEMPVYKSAIAWKSLTYGTLVTVGP